ncbi:DNA-deoxyinosine glycosylase [Desulfopila aestuarii]|uniref:G/U mismatch-specific uracil-DNA glycosylase n=1 Tax=Desulfopila aestuarii DSM 18488 TaxID=1121416 RepID=A0A1M7Y8H1_9BACT|nr:DNA-deoxyinosine glycosylase [Desulfopila aestuarii]SHO48933.1 G/U mismatch-specific uracil-DNA glycosylase [Desulfopila aestuarii DSM 18488]
MNTLQSFPPVVDQQTRILILGSMPGRVSLSETQYYAHPRNGFWHIMGQIIGASFELDYERRLQILLANRIGLWDVIASCTRASSLDTDIDDSSIISNDFRSLLTYYPSIEQIFFNGTKAEQTFKRYVIPSLDTLLDHIRVKRLISTSPANARYSLEEKIDVWRTHLCR